MDTKVKSEIAVAVPKLALIEGKDKLEAFINKLQTTGEKFAHDIHLAACSALSHLKQHGDSYYCTKLVKAMTGAVRVATLRGWFEHYGKGLKWGGRAEDARFTGSATVDLEGALAHPFYGKAENAPVEKWDATADLSSVIAFLKSHIKKAETHKAKALVKKYQAALADVAGVKKAQEVLEA